MTNYDIAHEFFYQDGQTFNKRYSSMSYFDNRFFSYNTIIGKKIIGKNDKKYLLLSDNNFSNTTSKHIRYLQQACPFNIIYIPIKYNQQDIRIDDTIESIIFNLDYYAKSKLSQKANRDSYIKYFNMLVVIDENIQTIKKSIIKKYQPLFDILMNDESLKELKKKIQEKQKQELEKLKKKLNSYLKKYDLSELAKMVYDWQDKTLEDKKDIKQAIKKYINPNDDLSFVWSDGDNFKTSKSITISKQDCQLIIDLYKNGKLKHGLKLNQYTILEVTDKFIKIGCHKIPVENINCLI